MALKYGKREIAKVVKTIDAEHPTAESAAKAALEAMEEIFRDRAKFVVVGQLKYTRADGTLQPSDPRAIKVSLGWYSTEGEATKAAESLVHGTATGDEFRAWVLPVHHGTPAELHAKRKKEIEEQAQKAKEKQWAKIREEIAKRQQEEAERARA